MKNKKEAKFDYYMRSHVGVVRSFSGIEPPKAFLAETMREVIKIEKRRAAIRFLGVCCLALIPIFIRAGWESLRNDAFSVSSMPLGGFVMKLYQWSMSPMTIYTLIILAVGFLIYMARYRSLKPYQPRFEEQRRAA